MLKLRLHFFPVLLIWDFLCRQTSLEQLCEVALWARHYSAHLYLPIKINFPLLCWLNYLKSYKGFIGRLVSRVPPVFHSVNLYGTDCQNFILVIVAPVLNCVDTSFKDWPYSLVTVKLFPFARTADRLPVISFTTFSTWCTIGWAFSPRMMFSTVVTEFPFLLLTNSINTPVFLMTFTASC